MRYHLTCSRCGHVWRPRKDERPKWCPKCKVAAWDTAPKWRVDRSIVDARNRKIRGRYRKPTPEENIARMDEEAAAREAERREGMPPDPFIYS